ncbi:MAG TPA: hypothetical protein VE978_02535 [Chitinophagales bacterium]|nr:hypothetical protein [Chitinophagales bacterium]
MYIIHTRTNEEVECKIAEIKPKDLFYTRKEFSFDWIQEASKYSVYKLYTLNDQRIQGLISTLDERDFLFLNLIENAKTNVGSQKIFARVAGNLIAFAASLSLQQNDGFMMMIAKTKLINWYHETYGFVRLGNSNKMISQPDNSKKLVISYL